MEKKKRTEKNTTIQAVGQKITWRQKNPQISKYTAIIYSNNKLTWSPYQ